MNIRENLEQVQTNSQMQEGREFQQLSTEKQNLGRQNLGSATLTILWALRVYVVLMFFLIAWQITGPQILHLHP